mmetsp:Transcript_36895/g.72555  ORF Transcript_36895/g.72555 Transcript_36895/m.72555 type:complete len:88 (-) Transcript_36895:122-385(-)
MLPKNILEPAMWDVRYGAPLPFHISSKLTDIPPISQHFLRKHPTTQQRMIFDTLFKKTHNAFSFRTTSPSFDFYFSMIEPLSFSRLD